MVPGRPAGNEKGKGGERWGGEQISIFFKIRSGIPMIPMISREIMRVLEDSIEFLQSENVAQPLVSKLAPDRPRLDVWDTLGIQGLVVDRKELRLGCRAESKRANDVLTEID